MAKIIAALVLLISLIAGIFIYFKKPTLFFPIPFIKSENLPRQQTKDKQDVLSTTYNDLLKTTNKIVNTVKDQVYQRSQNTLDKVFDKKSSDTNVFVEVVNEAAPQDEKVVMDLSASGSLKLNLTRGKQYFLEFKNIQPDKCLFINSNKYELKDGSGIKISFAEAGIYKIKTGPCATLEKDIGEVVVN